jgi:hypothetical protein
MGGSTNDEVTYFVRLRPGESTTTASWLLRRAGSVDELLGRDGQWHPSPMLAAAERGEIPGTLRRTVAPIARGIVESVGEEYAAARRALEQQRDGEFTLRRAGSGEALERPRLDHEGRADVVAFLTGAPLVGAGADGSLRTDGMWVWSDALAATVQASGRMADGEFLFHIETRRFLFPEQVGPAVIERARQLLASGAQREAQVPGRPAPPTEQQRLAALSSWHAEWQRKHEASTPFRPELHTGAEDYNLHSVDLEASTEAEREFTMRAREIMGLDPVTGAKIDI